MSTKRGADQIYAIALFSSTTLYSHIDENSCDMDQVISLFIEEFNKEGELNKAYMNDFKREIALKNKFEGMRADFAKPSSEGIHHDFICELDITRNKLQRIFSQSTEDQKRLYLLTYWLVIVPRQIFEGTFMEDNNLAFYPSIITQANISNGKECVYMSQAYILWKLKQVYKNDKQFEIDMSFSFSDIVHVLETIFGPNNTIFRFLNDFFDILGEDELKMGPQNWDTTYVGKIVMLLISDKAIMNNIFYNIDQNVDVRQNFLLMTAKLFKSQRELALNMSRDPVFHMYIDTVCS